jgi:hypothetical protein
MTVKQYLEKQGIEPSRFRGKLYDQLEPYMVEARRNNSAFFNLVADILSIQDHGLVEDLLLSWSLRRRDYGRPLMSEGFMQQLRYLAVVETVGDQPV